MSSHLDEAEFSEPERYELREGPFYHFELNRRDFVATLGAGLVISVSVRARPTRLQNCSL